MWNILAIFGGTKQTFVSIPVPLPDPKLVFKIKSSWQERFYLTDLPNQTCTCDDFLKHAHAFKIGDIRRCCRHLLKAYHYERTKKLMASVPEYNSIPEHIWAVILDGHVVREIWIKEIFGSPIVLTRSIKGGEWLNIFLRKKKKGDTENRTGKYERLGFSLVKHQWSYGVGPKGASNAIRAMIENMRL